MLPISIDTNNYIYSLIIICITNFVEPSLGSAICWQKSTYLVSQNVYPQTTLGQLGTPESAIFRLSKGSMSPFYSCN